MLDKKFLVLARELCKVVGLSSPKLHDTEDVALSRVRRAARRLTPDDFVPEQDFTAEYVGVRPDVLVWLRNLGVFVPDGVREKITKPAVRRAVQDGLENVTIANTRPYYAGAVLHGHGLEKGVTEEMIADLDRLYGVDNPAESKYALRNAFHAVRGYLEEMERKQNEE